MSLKPDSAMLKDYLGEGNHFAEFLKSEHTDNSDITEIEEFHVSSNTGFVDFSIYNERNIHEALEILKLRPGVEYPEPEGILYSLYTDG